MAGGHTRAGFLGTGAAALGGAALAGTWRPDRAAAAAAVKIEDGTVTEGAFDARFAGDSFYFELDGAPAGRLDGVTGGVPYAEVVTEKIGPDFLAKKHITNVKYEDISVTCGTGMSKGFYNWIKDSFDGKESRRTGTVVAFDKTGAITGSAQFTEALITEFTVPALDAGSKDAAKMTIKFRPETTKYLPRKGKAPALGGGAANIAAGNFKLVIDGLPTGRVSKIDSFTIKQGVVQNDVGELRQYHPAKIEVPNLAFIFSGDLEQAWFDYAEDFIIKGNSGEANERAGTLRLLDKKSNELFTLSFSHLGIFKGTAEASENNSDRIRRFKMELYAEQIQFNYASSASA